jgi:hypothetical protein
LSVDERIKDCRFLGAMPLHFSRHEVRHKIERIPPSRRNNSAFELCVGEDTANRRIFTVNPLKWLHLGEAICTEICSNHGPNMGLNCGNGQKIEIAHRGVVYTF